MADPSGPEAIKTPGILEVEIDLGVEAAWEAWVDVGRAPEEIYYLWAYNAEVLPQVRRHALMCLTKPPSEVHSPSFYYPISEPGIGWLLGHLEVVDGQTTSSLSTRFRDRPQLARELSSALEFRVDEGLFTHFKPDTHEGSLYLTAMQELVSIDAPVNTNVSPDTTVDALVYENGTGAEPEAASLQSVSDRMTDLLFKNIGEWDDPSTAGRLGSFVQDTRISSQRRNDVLDRWLKHVGEEISADYPQPPEPVDSQSIEEINFRPGKITDGLIWSMHTTIEGEVDWQIFAKMVEFLEMYLPDNQWPYMHGFDIGQIAEHLDDDNLFMNFAWRHIFPDEKYEGVVAPFSSRNSVDDSMIRDVIRIASGVLSEDAMKDVRAVLADRAEQERILNSTLLNPPRLKISPPLDELP